MLIMKRKGMTKPPINMGSKYHSENIILKQELNKLRQIIKVLSERKSSENNIETIESESQSELSESENGARKRKTSEIGMEVSNESSEITNEDDERISEIRKKLRKRNNLKVQVGSEKQKEKIESTQAESANMKNNIKKKSNEAKKRKTTESDVHINNETSQVKRVVKEINKELIEKLRNLNETKKNAQIVTNNTRSERVEINKENTQNEYEVNNKKKGGNEKLPPINIYNQNIPDIVKAIKEHLEINDFSLKKINKNKYAIYAFSILNYSKIKEMLGDIKCPYYTFTPRNEKVKTILLKGLDSVDEPTEIFKILEEQNTEDMKFLGVKRFVTKHSKANNYNTAIFVVQVTQNTKMNNVYNIKSIDNRIIKWEHLIKSNGITQCVQCQRYGHTASNCTLKHRCVKCGGDHGPGPNKCPIIGETNSKEKLYCIMCKQYGHPASYKGCSRYKELIENLHKKKEDNMNKKNHVRNVVHSLSQPAGNTYANVTKGNIEQKKEPNIPWAELFNAIKVMNDKIDKFENVIKDQNRRINILYENLNRQNNYDQVE